MAEENLCASGSSSPARKRSREIEEVEEENEDSSNKKGVFDILPEAKRAHGGAAQDADLMALLDRIDKMDNYIDDEQVVTKTTEEETSGKDSSSSNGDMENELSYNFFLDSADELAMNYFDFLDEDLMAVYSAANHGFMHDYTEVPGTLWEDDIWQVTDSPAVNNDGAI